MPGTTGLAPATTNDSPDLFIGRQPIFDRTLNLYAYELLFRSSEANHAEIASGACATSEVLVNAFTEFGLESIVGEGLAFVNLTRDFLVGARDVPLPNERVVLEILEDVLVDEVVVAGVTRLKEAGYQIALDDFVYDSDWQPLVEIADIIKIDVLGMPVKEIEHLVTRLKPYPVRLLAEKIESEEEFEMLRDLGFDYFQGYFLARPKVLTGRKIPANQIQTLRLLQAIQSPDTDFPALETIISGDVGLSYKILKFINSAYIGMPRKVDSINHAIVCLGLTAMKRWASLLAMSSQSDRPPELLRTALIRARMCELLAQNACVSESDSCFTLGLFSCLDALLQRPMADLLRELPLSDDLVNALVGEPGVLAESLACVIAYEQADWSNVRYASLAPVQIRNSYLDAVEWAEESVAGLG